MREKSALKTDRWDWYGKGDETCRLQPARGTEVGDDDNSPEQVLWEFGLVFAAFLVCAAIAGTATQFL